MIQGLNEYQERASDTWNPPPRDKRIDISYLALGLSNEAGETAGKIKKLLRGDKELSDEFIAALKYELGDTLWYLSQLALEFNLTLADIATANIEKLADRKERGVIKGDGDNR